MKSTKNTILLIDASGSMCVHVSNAKETIKSIIKEMDVDTHLTLVYFDSGAYEVAAKDLVKNINPMVADTYSARGGTPITPSVWRAIEEITGEVKDLSELAEEYKFIIFTDGGHNDSKGIKDCDLGVAIEHFTENFGWEFNFIGPVSCETEIKRYTDSIKIKKENVTLYTDVSEGLKEMKELAIA